MLHKVAKEEAGYHQDYGSGIRVIGFRLQGVGVERLRFRGAGV